MKVLSVDKEMQRDFFESQNFEISSLEDTFSLLDSMRTNIDLQNEYFSKNPIPKLTNEIDLCEFIEFIPKNPELIKKVLNKHNDMEIRSSTSISLLLYNSIKYPELKEDIDKLIK